MNANSQRSYAEQEDETCSKKEGKKE